MPIGAGNLVSYPCTDNPETNTGQAGGAMLTNGKLTFATDTLNTEIEMLSSSTGDTTQTVTIRQRHFNGELEDRSGTLNGTTPVEPTPLGTCNRILKITLSADCVGTVTVRGELGGATYGQVPPNFRYLIRLFPNADDTVGPLYSKTFWYNNNGGFAAINPVLRLTSDPSSKIRQGVHTSLNDTAVITNRTTAPGGVTFVDDGVDQSAPANLGPLDKIGVWWELTVSGAPIFGDATSNFTSQITVQTI